MVENLKEEDIIKYWRFLGHKSQTEIRAIKPKWIECDKLERTKSIFINNAVQLVEEIKKINGEYNIYLGINERRNNGTEDADVEFITNIGHDLDAHGKGAVGLMKAGQIAFKIKDLCLQNGFKEPLILNSGRGYWVIHHLPPIVNNEENVKKIKEFGKKIKLKHEEEPIEFDTVVYNPSRIARIPGTLNISEKDNFILSSIMNNPNGEEDYNLRDEILAIKIFEYKPNPLATTNNEQSICSFMDYCLTHEIPKGERHKTISRNMAIYIAEHPDRELLKQQYYKIQKGSEGELDNYLKGIDEKGKDAFPFSIGELVNFTKKYKIPFDWKTTPEYKQWILSKKAEDNLKEEIAREEEEEATKKEGKYLFSEIGKLSNFLNIAEEFIKIQPVYYDKYKIWWIWNHPEFKWERIDETDILNFIDNATKNPSTNSTIKAELLEGLRRKGRLNKPKEPKESWVQFGDKIYDLESEEVLDAKSEYFITNPINWKMGETEETPALDILFKSWVGEENYLELYELLAFCIVPCYFIHRIFCLIGSGANGKSTFLNVLSKFIGEDNITSSSLFLLMGQRFEGSKLLKKLTCLMGETNFNMINNTDYIKKLTGQDLVRAEFKGKDCFDFRNYAKLIIATNSLPPTADKTDGFYRRWKIMEFNNKFKEERDVLFNVQDEEYENLALKCFNMAKRLWKERKFTNDGDFEQRRKVYEDKSNPLMAFIKENYEKNIQKEVLFSEFYDDLSEYLESRGFRSLSAKAVSQQVKNEGFEIKTFQKKDINGRFIIGINHINHINHIPIPFLRDMGNVEKVNIVNIVTSNPFQSYEKPNNDIHMNIIVPEKPKEQTEKEAFFKEMEYH